MSVSNGLPPFPAQGPVSVCWLSFSASLPAELPFHRESGYGQ